MYDPATPFKCPTEEVLHRAEAFWIGPHNSQVNTLESDAVAKAKTEWVQVRGAPLNISETDGLKPGAFGCLDVRESEQYYDASFKAIIKLAPSLLLRGGCLLVMGNIQQVRTVLFSYSNPFYIYNLELFVLDISVGFHRKFSGQSS